MTETMTLIEAAHSAEVARIAATVDFSRASDRAGRLGTPASFIREDKAHAAMVARTATARAAVTAALARMKAEGITEYRLKRDGVDVDVIAFTNEDYAALGFTRALD